MALSLRPVLVTPPAVPLITRDEVKAYSRIDGGDEDALIEVLIAAATAWLDGWRGILGRALVNQTWRQDFACFEPRMVLPLGPVQSIVSVKYYDSANVLQTASSALYSLVTGAGGEGRVVLNSAQSWPGVYDRDDPVQITYVAGYGAAAADVDGAIRQAALMMVGHWYAVREPVIVGAAVSEVPLTVEALIGPYRRVGV